MKPKEKFWEFCGTLKHNIIPTGAVRYYNEGGLVFLFFIEHEIRYFRFSMNEIIKMAFETGCDWHQMIHLIGKEIEQHAHFEFDDYNSF